jgi:hypothetical protein
VAEHVEARDAVEVGRERRVAGEGGDVLARERAEPRGAEQHGSSGSGAMAAAARSQAVGERVLR